ncbi:hypothetical protein L3049_00605 [Labilibaculum sp. DW002]|jgi:hypothetical protein|uniref:STAS/SEC14 domain-containing protein n=1 Tax=Paralabilibaculum antarcticum TaxID=2912572 RepID=A0ABT5VP04_9BACT|nr:hypothetical protein [Labilibaculum sp. DW002]MDE5416487.1 hypothetical protein [Labilibaculum sp. DW002]
MIDVYKYSILKDVGLIIQYHQNNITKERMKQLKSNIINDKDFNPKFGFIVDIRKAKVNLTENELLEYGNWVNENLKLTGLMRLVLLTSTPDHVTKTIIFSLNENISPLQYKTFSTLAASVKWLNIDLENLDFIEKEIEILSTP